MLDYLVKKYKNRKSFTDFFDGEDINSLIKVILSAPNSHDLQSAIYMYGYSTQGKIPHPAVLEVCLKNIENTPLPGLTATCLRCVLDFWSMEELHYKFLGNFLNYDLYEVWYDEVHFCANFIKRTKNLKIKAMHAEQYESLLRKAALNNDSDLLEFLNS